MIKLLVLMMEKQGSLTKESYTIGRDSYEKSPCRVGMAATAGRKNKGFLKHNDTTNYS